MSGSEKHRNLFEELQNYKMHNNAFAKDEPQMFDSAAQDQPKPSPVFTFDIVAESAFGSSARCHTINEEEKESTFSSKPKLFRPSLTNKFESRNERLETDLDSNNS